MSLESKKPTMLDQEIGARIRRQCKALNMSQTTLGLAAGISYQQVVKYEKGDNRTHPVELVAFARSLDVPVSYFFGEGREELGEDEAVFQFVETAEGIELNSAFGQIVDSEKRHMFVDIVEDLGDLHSRLGLSLSVRPESRTGI